MGAPPSMSRQVLPMLFADLKKKELASSLYFTQHFSGILGRQPDSGLLDMSTVNRYEATSARCDDILVVLGTFLVGKLDHPDAMAKQSVFGRWLDCCSRYHRPQCLPVTLDHLAREQGITLSIVTEVNTFTAMKDIAFSGHALTILTVLAIREEQSAGVLKGVRMKNPAIRCTIPSGFSRQRLLYKEHGT